jgi:hypothetical protein
MRSLLSVLGSAVDRRKDALDPPGGVDRRVGSDERRIANRFQVNYKTQLFYDGLRGRDQLDGTVNNISQSGCLFLPKVQRPLGDIGARPEIAFPSGRLPVRVLRSSYIGYHCEFCEPLREDFIVDFVTRHGGTRRRA